MGPRRGPPNTSPGPPLPPVRTTILPRPSLPRPATCNEGAVCKGVIPCRILGCAPLTSHTSPPCPPTPSAAVVRTLSSTPTTSEGHTSVPSPPTAHTWHPQRPLTLTSAPRYRRQVQTETKTCTLVGRNAMSPCPHARKPPTCPVPNQIQVPRVGDTGQEAIELLHQCPSHHTPAPILPEHLLICTYRP